MTKRLTSIAKEFCIVILGEKSEMRPPDRPIKSVPIKCKLGKICESSGRSELKGPIVLCIRIISGLELSQRFKRVNVLAFPPKPQLLVDSIIIGEPLGGCSCSKDPNDQLLSAFTDFLGCFFLCMFDC